MRYGILWPSGIHHYQRFQQESLVLLTELTELTKVLRPGKTHIRTTRLSANLCPTVTARGAVYATFLREICTETYFTTLAIRDDPVGGL